MYEMKWEKDIPMAKRGVFLHMALWGAIFGSVGFVGGFFGPIIFRPTANQGPFLGIFLTGPFGFLAGALFGLVRWIKKTD
ncbi:hypothetical protein L4X63_21200 [Geomonas sp. Red32]|uniref:hypothetical protein n=1 Tax=Geomonas sp. Red32 TaxID=2912856 RepID=UPI00202D025B|nr:hypothetical protein [Geomonas sp. Red32]MCM0084103.1 hypothetical protein [Geomonas sp. Red32]